MSRNLLYFFFVMAFAIPAPTNAGEGTLTVPAAAGPLVVDGQLDESIWQSAAVLPLKAAGFGAPFPADGEARIVVRGNFLCLAARLPERRRVVALSVGRNPLFLREDRTVWTFYTYAAGRVRKSVVLTVNPLGGFRLDDTLPIGQNQPLGRIPGGIQQGEDWRSIDPLVYLMPVEAAGSGQYAMATARVNADAWVVEAAVPIAYFDSGFGYMEIERIRVPRPDAPELSWRWPGPNLRSEFQFAKSAGIVPAPAFRPVIPGDPPEIAVPNLPQLPDLNSPWNGPAWQSAAKLELKRGEGNPGTPGLQTELRLVHHEHMLALFAHMAEVQTSLGTGTWHTDNLQVFLSPSGAGYMQITAGRNGMATCAIGNGGGGRLWPFDRQRSKVVVRSNPDAHGWTLRMDIPLAEIAAVFQEPVDSDQWRILIRRSYTTPGGSQAEITSFPLVQTPTPLCPARYAQVRFLAGGLAQGTLENPGSKPKSGLTAELTALPSQVWSAPERQKLGIDLMLEKKLRTSMAEAAEREKRDWQKVQTRADWEQFRRQRLDALRKWIGPFPERTPLHAVVTKRADYGDGFVIENIVFESRPNFLVSANLYLPQNVTGRIPAIVVVHCHHASKTQSELQDMGMNWARAGAAVLVMDQIGAGERVETNPWLREGYYSHYDLEIQLQLAGESLMKWMVWDLIRGIDLLLERPYIDAQRIAMIGSVAGGGDPAALTAALDDRIAAVVPFNFGEAGPEEHYLRGPRGYDFDTAWPGWGSWDMTRNLPRSVADQFFPWFICASVAPRRFIYAFEMGWPNGVEGQPAWARYKKVFDFYGKREFLAEVHGFGPFPGPGERPNVGVEHRWAIYPILKRWFDIAAPADEYHNPRPETELRCLNPAVAAERRPKSTSTIVFDVAKRSLEAARSRMAGFESAARVARLRTVLNGRLGDIEPNLQAQARTVWSKNFADFQIDGLSLETEPGITLPLLLVRPSVSDRSQELPVVVAFAQSGKGSFLADRSTELALLLKRGVAVCLADVRGTGEAAAGDARGPGSMTLATVELMLGNTMLGAQLKDARTIVRYLAQRPDLDARRLVLWGESFAGVNPRRTLIDESPNLQVGPDIHAQAEPLGATLALLTALYEDGVHAVALHRGLGSYLSVLQDRFCYVPLDMVIPGLLESADTPDLVAALFPRAVLIEGFVDGRNRLLDMPQLKAEMAPAYAGYGNSSSQLNLREDAALDVADWLVQQCRGN